MRKILDFTGQNFSSTGKISAYNPDGLLFVLQGLETEADLAKIKVSVVMKNGKGKDLLPINSVPLLYFFHLSDYLGGYAWSSADLLSSAYVALGNYILQGDDSLSVTISASGLSIGSNVVGSVYACDDKVGAEQMLVYEYVEGQNTLEFAHRGVHAIYLKSSDETTVIHSMTTRDFYGSENVDGLAVLAMGGALGKAEKWLGFGPLWSDKTGLTQDVRFSTYTGQGFLVCREEFDRTRMGMEQKSVQETANLLQYYASNEKERFEILAQRLR
ncbi:MAG: hypothetical protein JJE17_07385 [Peptostreptococcaceae bacterium]|nr:hypothetical protein [Peptostreptococcaceae bacterium]